MGEVSGDWHLRSAGGDGCIDREAESHMHHYGGILALCCRWRWQKGCHLAEKCRCLIGGLHGLIWKKKKKTTAVLRQGYKKPYCQMVQQVEISGFLFCFISISRSFIFLSLCKTHSQCSRGLHDATQTSVDNLSVFDQHILHFSFANMLRLPRKVKKEKSKTKNVLHKLNWKYS